MLLDVIQLFRKQQLHSTSVPVPIISVCINDEAQYTSANSRNMKPAIIFYENENLGPPFENARV